MHKVVAIISLCMGLLSPLTARGDLIFLSDRVIDTRTQLVWLNVYAGDALVNPHNLADVSGGWRHASGNQIVAFFFNQFGITTLQPAPLRQTVVDLTLNLGGHTTSHPIAMPGSIVTGIGYTITGWYRSDFPGAHIPSFDEATLEYMGDPTGMWYANMISTIGSWTSLDNHPHPITFPQPHFLISSLVPEPPIVALLAIALGAAGLRVRSCGRKA
jgi:hypothetical protein